MLGKASICIAICALAALFALPATAGATVYCVDTTPAELGDNDSIDASCETPSGTLGAALQAAESNAGTDSVLVGPGNYALPSAPNAAEAAYTNMGDVVHVRGIGKPHLTMGGTSEHEIGINLVPGSGSSIEGLALTIPANVDSGFDTGFRIGGAGVVARDLNVDGPSASRVAAISLLGGAKLVESTVALPMESASETEGVSATSGGAALEDVEIEARTGVHSSGFTVTVDRSSIHAWTPVFTSLGTLVVRDSLLRLANESGAIGVRLINTNGTATIDGTLDGVTIVGGEASSTTGVRVMAYKGEQTATAAISNTVISGPATALFVGADAEREAKATVSRSNYDPAKVILSNDLDGTGTTGTATYLPSQVTDFAPGFVDPAAGNYHLAAGSPMIDQGDPAAPAAGRLDLDGEARAIAASCGGPAIRDIGADEYAGPCTPAAGREEGGTPGGGTPQGGGQGGAPQPQLPSTTIALKGKHRIVTAKRRVRVTALLGSDVSGASYRCKVDGKPYRACGATFSIALRPGKHTIAAVAVSAAGADPTPATAKLTIVRNVAR